MQTSEATEPVPVSARYSVESVPMSASPGRHLNLFQPPVLGLWNQRMMAAAAGLGMVLAAMDIALNVALPAITHDLNTDLQTVQWVIIVFVATRAGLVLSAGSFADRFGLRQVYLFGAATYLVAMIAIALSPNLGTVVAFRVVQALGTGCLYAVSPAIVARLFPAHRRGLGMGLTTASQAAGMLIATLGAGLLVQWFGWESVFLARVPFVVLAMVLGFVWLERAPQRVAGPKFDVAGAVTLIAGLLCLVIGLRLGRSIGWTSEVVLVLLPLAPVFLLTFWWAEGKSAWPILPRELLRAPGFVISNLSMFLAHLGVFVIWFIFPFYIGDGLNREPVILGLLLGVMAGLNIAFSTLGGWLCDRIGVQPVGVAGLAVVAGGLMYMGFLDSDSGVVQVGSRVAIIGVGLGLFQSAAYALMMSSISPERFGTASAALSLAQAFGTVLSVALIGGIFAASTGLHLGDLAASGLTPEDRDAQAFIMAFQDVFRIGGAAVVVSAGAFTLSRRRRGAN